MWGYLDEINFNLLYEYAECLAGAKAYTHFSESDYERKKNAYYIIHFVYKYALGCETLEEAYAYADDKTLEKYNLTSFFNGVLFVGTDDSKILLRTQDIRVVLEIIYKKYDFWEQLKCLCVNSNTIYRQKLCRRALKTYQTMYGRITNEEKIEEK